MGRFLSLQARLWSSRELMRSSATTDNSKISWAELHSQWLFLKVVMLIVHLIFFVQRLR